MTRNAIEFDSAGITLADHLYSPDTGSTALPAIVVGHPVTRRQGTIGGLVCRTPRRTGLSRVPC